MDDETLLRELYVGFNARELDGVLARLTDDVEWPDAWEGGRAVGIDAVRDYWMRQWATIDPRADPVSFARRSDGRVDVLVRQTVNALDGSLLFAADVHHVYALRDGKIAAMDVEE